MTTKKWFGLAAVVAAVGGAVGLALTKVRSGSEKASDLPDESSQEASAEMETVGS